MTDVQIYDQGNITEMGAGYTSYIRPILLNSCAVKLDEDEVLFIGGYTNVLLLHTISTNDWEKKEGNINGCTASR